MEPEKNDVGVLDVANGRQIQLWCGDLWKCPGCGVEVVAGIACQPAIENWMPGFAKVVEDYRVGSLVVESRQ
jgi:hypothetical protein